MTTKRGKPNTEQDNITTIEVLEAIHTQLDVIISLLLDLMPEESFSNPRLVSHKTHRLNLTRVKLRDTDIGRMVGSPSKDVSRRLSEYDSTEVVKRSTKMGSGHFKEPASEKTDAFTTRKPGSGGDNERQAGR